MPRNIFKRALSFAVSHGETVSLGGGEPTDHPNFYEYLGMSLGEAEHVWLATNGSNTNTALALSGLASGSERLSVALSQDAWHDPIDPSVPIHFKGNNNEIRTVTEIANHGSASENGLGTKDQCLCGGVQIRPNGDIQPCACDDAPVLGNVMDATDKVEAILQSLTGDYCVREWDTLEEVCEQYNEDLTVADLEDYSLDIPVWENVEAACGKELTLEGYY